MTYELITINDNEHPFQNFIIRLLNFIKMRKILLFTVLSLIFLSCGKTKNTNGFSNDMENVKIWGSSSSVVKGFAHSGSFASKLDSSNMFSFGMQSLVENLSKDKPKEVHVKLWVYSLKPNPDATIVIAINNNGQSRYWKNSALNGVTKAKEWTEVSASFDLPANLDSKDELSVFVWNPKQQDLYIDDLNVSFK
jgi:hypothetical protein